MQREDFPGEGLLEVATTFLASLLKRWRRYARRRQARKSRQARKLSKLYRRRFKAQVQ